MSDSSIQIKTDKINQFYQLNPTSGFRFLPRDILTYIFSFLTDKEAFIAAHVCGAWKEQLEQLPSFQRTFNERAEEVQDYYRLENTLNNVSKFHLNLLYTDKDWNERGGFPVTSFGVVSDSGFITVPYEHREGEFTFFSKERHFLINSMCIGTVNTTGIFLEPNQPFSVSAHGVDGHFRRFHIYTRNEDLKTKYGLNDAHFKILNGFILPSEDIAVVTVGGVIEIWNIEDDKPTLIYYDIPFENRSEVRVRDVSLLGSHLILICTGLKTPLFSMDLDKKTLSAIVLKEPIPLHENDEIALETIGKRCIVRIGSELVCFKEENGKIEVRWRKSNAALTGSKRPKNGCFIKADSTESEEDFQINLETGELSPSKFTNARFGYEHYCISFEAEKISFLSLANNPIGNSDGYPLVLPRKFENKPFTLLDVAASEKRIFVLASTDDTQRYMLELTSESLDQGYVFSEEFFPEDRDSSDESSSSHEKSDVNLDSKAEVQEHSILPIAPVEERLEAKEYSALIRENSEGIELIDENFESPYVTSMKVTAIVALILALMLTAGMFTAYGMGMTNLTLGLGLASGIAASISFGSIFYMKG